MPCKKVFYIFWSFNIILSGNDVLPCHLKWLNCLLKADDVYKFIDPSVFLFVGEEICFYHQELFFALGIIGWMIFEKIHLPKIVFYTILGIILGPSLLGF